MRFLWFFFLLFGQLSGQNSLTADFTTTEGDFSVELDFLNAPLTVSNFIHLAGKGDDIFETPDNVPLLTSEAHYRQSFYQTISESDTQRLPLRVDFFPETAETEAFYGIFHGEVFLGAVEETVSDQTFLQDISGQDRVRLELVSGNPLRYRITLRYPRPWLDARDLRVRAAPMYQRLRINRVENGRRFFAGSMTRSLVENPGYEFQDEVLRNLGNTSNPFGAPFNTAWVIAMDSVGPNRNGSRFFITTAADRSLNGRHTAFGIVTRNIGRSVVAGITSAETDADQNPVNDMFIENITIRRTGPVAMAFFEGIFQAMLPGEITEVPLELERSGGVFSLSRPSRPGSQFVVFSSDDLVSYSGGLFAGQSPQSLEASLTDITGMVTSFPRSFFRGFQTDVSVWPSEVVDLDGARFLCNVTSGTDQGSLNFNLSADGLGGFVGTYDIDTRIVSGEAGDDEVVEEARGSGSFSARYDSSQGPYQGVFTFTNVTGPLDIDELVLQFDFHRLAGNPTIPGSQFISRFDARRSDQVRGFLSYGGIYRKFD